MEKVLCYYHGDNDGIASAAIVNKYYTENHGQEKSCFYIWYF